MNVPRNLAWRVDRWAETLGIDPSRLPDPFLLDASFDGPGGPCRPGVEALRVDDWERRHGYRLPEGLRVWLGLSDGLWLGGPLVHPLSAIGPMVPFATIPELVVQPESWFELGNPGEETVCIDLAYRWPGGGCPIFTSGDDERGTRPRVVGPSFESWFLRLLNEGGRQFWHDEDHPSLGDPWEQHRRRTPMPTLPDRLARLAPLVLPLMRPGADDRQIADRFGVSRNDVEMIFRHLQHAPAMVLGARS